MTRPQPTHNPTCVGNFWQRKTDSAPNQLSDVQNGTVGASHAAELGFVWLGADGWSLGHGAAEPVSVVEVTHQGPGGGFC